MKIAVLTSSIGSTRLLDPIPFEGVDYHAFVDYTNDSSDWIKHPVISFSADTVYQNRRNAKVYKVLPFAFLPDYDYYFWVDSTHILEANPYKIIDNYLKDSDIAVFRHSERNCVYTEGNFVKKIRYDHPNLLEDQLAFYSDMCYPKDNGLYELPARVQRNTKLTQRLGWMWWEQICMFSSRDQISFPFVCHQLGIKPTILPGFANTIRGNTIMPQLVLSHHNRRI
jgi:hypothetical protein|tara:strand:- start:3425 stop:4099 length:675 start_codon:yes stop_codon:yes gene_type:complete